MKSSRFFLVGICIFCLVAPSAALGKKIAPRLTPTQQAIQADLIVVGRIVEIEEGDTEATAYQGAAQKTAYKVANVKIKETLLGTKGLTHIRVGFIPTNQPIERQLQFLDDESGYRFDSYSINDEGCFFLQKHHDGDFYVQLQWGNRLDTRQDKYDLELEKIKKLLNVVEKPMEALKSKKAEDRQFAACALLNKHRTYPRVIRGALKEEEVPKEESKLIFEALSEMEWGVYDPWGMSLQGVWHLINPQQQHGWVQPDPNANDFNAEMTKATQKWLKANAEKFSLKKYVMEKK